MFVEFAEGEIGDIEHTAPDETIGLGHVARGHDPLDGVGELYDTNRLLAALGQARDEFGRTDLAIGFIQPPASDMVHLAIYDPDRRTKAVLLPPRVQPEDGEPDA
jgi:hypothetical protein